MPHFAIPLQHTASAVCAWHDFTEYFESSTSSVMRANSCKIKKFLQKAQYAARDNGEMA